MYRIIKFYSTGAPGYRYKLQRRLSKYLDIWHTVNSYGTLRHAQSWAKEFNCEVPE